MESYNTETTGYYGDGYIPYAWTRQIGVNNIVYNSTSLWKSDVQFSFGSAGTTGATGIPNNNYFIKEKASISLNDANQNVSYEYMDYFINYVRPGGEPRLDITGRTAFKIQSINIINTTSNHIQSEDLIVKIFIMAPLVGIGIIIQSNKHFLVSGTDLYIPMSEFTTHPLYDPANVTEIDINIRSYRDIDSNVIVPLDMLLSIDKVLLL